MASSYNYIPPPVFPVGGLPELVEDGVPTLWRVHEEADPLTPPRYHSGKWRFDSPDSSYSVTYGNEHEYAVFAEVFGDSKQIAPNRGNRYYSRLLPTRPLRLIALEDPEVLAAFGLTTNISASTEYDRTMAWSQELYRWYDDADGIRYVGRHAAIRLNYCLFLDHCGDALEVETEGQLKDLRPLVMRACDLFNLAPRLFDPTTGSGWV